MSKHQNQELSFWIDVLTSLRRTPSYREGIMLTKRDNETVCQVLILNVLILKDTAQEAGYRTNSNLKRWCNFAHSLEIQLFDEMQKSVLAAIRNHRGFCTYDEFKQRLSAFGPSQLGAFLAPVRDYLELFLEVASPSAFRILNQFFSFCARTSLEDVDFTPKMMADYYATENRLSDLVLPDQAILTMNSIVRKWLKGFKLQPLRPRHGPGSTAELPRTSQHMKFEKIRFDQRLLYLIKDTDVLTTLPSDPLPGLVRRAKVTFVKKNLSTMRTICKEPTSLMYYQEGCLDQIVKYIDRHPFLGARLQLDNQQSNRDLAWLGSIDGSYSTIDLSAASDSVSWELVKRVFAGTDYYKACLLTRSTSVLLPDGAVITPKKFAPMGSALCFPTECLIFLAACEYVAQQQGIRKPASYSVYGDDIAICPELTLPLIEFLGKIGFVVNSSKSFITGRFRESCGGEYFEGYDVTPIRIPRNYTGQKVTVRSPGLFRMLVDLCNQLHKRKMRLARAFLIKRLQQLPTELQPIFDDGTLGLISDQPTNYHLTSKEDINLQACFFAAGNVKSKYPSNRTEDDTLLFLWHSTAATKRYYPGQFPDPESTTVVQSGYPVVTLSSSRFPDEKGSKRLSDTRKYQESKNGIGTTVSVSLNES